MIFFVRHIAGLPAPVRIWVAALGAVNLASVFFLDRPEGRVVLGGMLLGAIIQMAIFARQGFVRLLGIGHFHWFPMLYWLFSRLGEIRTESALFTWIALLLIFDGISLIIDVADVVKYIAGDREPQIVVS
jgi:hypothetical protein